MSKLQNFANLIEEVLNLRRRPDVSTKEGVFDVLAEALSIDDPQIMLRIINRFDKSIIDSIINRDAALDDNIGAVDNFSPLYKSDMPVYEVSDVKTRLATVKIIEVFGAAISGMNNGERPEVVVNSHNLHNTLSKFNKIDFFICANKSDRKKSLSHVITVLIRSLRGEPTKVTVIPLKSQKLVAGEFVFSHHTPEAEVSKIISETIYCSPRTKCFSGASKKIGADIVNALRIADSIPQYARIKIDGADNTPTSLEVDRGKYSNAGRIASTGGKSSPRKTGQRLFGSKKNTPVTI